jgi:hypothetical protein
VANVKEILGFPHDIEDREDLRVQNCIGRSGVCDDLLSMKCTEIRYIRGREYENESKKTAIERLIAKREFYAVKITAAGGSDREFISNF